VSSAGPDRAAIEAPIRLAYDARDYSVAATALIDVYGQEILSFLCAMLRTPEEAGDAFQIFCEEMWKSIEKFRGESSFRTWSYAIARHAGHRIVRDPHRRAERAVPLSQAPQVQAMADRIRTTTLRYLRTEAKDQIRSLREQLDDEERTLFILRLDREMSWSQIAQVFEADTSDEAQLTKRAAALRKRFQRAKERLRTLAEEAGMLDAGA
jgi:RNA polymerase sigma-70 factor (ECF subfamily)